MGILGVGVGLGPEISMASSNGKYGHDTGRLLVMARCRSARNRLRSFSTLCRHCTGVFEGVASGHLIATVSATSCQSAALRLPRRRLSHLSRYASIRARVSSWVQQGGGRRREEVEVGGAGRERRAGD